METASDCRQSPGICRDFLQSEREPELSLFNVLSYPDYSIVTEFPMETSCTTFAPPVKVIVTTALDTA